MVVAATVWWNREGVHVVPPDRVTFVVCVIRHHWGEVFVDVVGPYLGVEASDITPLSELASLV